MTSLLAPVTDFSDLGIIFNPPTDIKGLDPALHDTLSNLVTVWNRKRARAIHCAPGMRMENIGSATSASPSRRACGISRRWSAGQRKQSTHMPSAACSMALSVRTAATIPST